MNPRPTCEASTDRLSPLHESNSSQRRACPSHGFTLLEVMITVAIVAILAGIALPSYQDYIQRSKIIEATAGLSDMRTRLEQYFLDSRQYPNACIAPAGGAAPAGKIYLPAGTEFFDFVCNLQPAANTYTVTATGKAAMAMNGFRYTVNQANSRQTTGLPSGWSGSGSPCWVIRKDGSC